MTHKQPSTMTHHKRPLLLALFFCFANTSLAQTAPNAGSIFQEVEQSRSKTPPPPLTPSPAHTHNNLQRTEHTVQIHTVRFINNTDIDIQELEQVAQPYLNRAITFDDLQNLAAAIGNLYQQHGRLVHTLYPEQDITNGIVTLQIVEARLDDVQIENNASRIPNTRLEKTIQHATSNAPLLFGIERGMGLINDLLAPPAQYSLKQGQAEQSVTMRVTVPEQPSPHIQMSLDNHGSRSTGRTRLITQTEFNHLSALADRLGITTLNTQGISYIQTSYSMPIGYQGFRLGVNASDLHYTVIEDSLSSVQAQGNFRALGLETSYPIVRQRNQALSINGSFQQKDFENFNNSTISSQYSSRVLSVGVQGFRARPNQPSNNINGHVSISTGIIDSTTPETPPTRFEKLNYSIGQHIALGQQWQLKAELQGQHSKNALDSSEKFYLGGALGVRSYPSNEGSASNGNMLSIELTKALRPDLHLTGFYDWGKLKSRSTEAPSSSTYILKGTGLSLRWQASARCQLEGTLAHRIGQNPNPTSTGSDQDGTRDDNRLWLNMRWVF